jgi:tetratricopeptide (TPR) repeat protein
MAWTFTRAELETARDEAATLAAERPGKVKFQRLGRALRWLDEEAAARRAFQDGATAMKTRVLDRGRGQHASGWAEYGELLRSAGEVDAAREYFERALAELGDEQSVSAAILRYRLGLPPGPAPDGPVWAQALAALASGSGLGEARDAVVRTIRAERLMPLYESNEMTLYDLLEETFRVEAERDGSPVPDHATMLERAKLLGDRAPAPELVPPPRGRWSVGDASIEQPDRGPVQATLNADLWLEFRDLGLGKWDITLVHAQKGRLNESGPFDGFGDAVEGAKDALRSNADERAVETLDALVRAY